MEHSLFALLYNLSYSGMNPIQSLLLFLILWRLQLLPKADHRTTTSPLNLFQNNSFSTRPTPEPHLRPKSTTEPQLPKALPRVISFYLHNVLFLNLFPLNCQYNKNESINHVRKWSYVVSLQLSFYVLTVWIKTTIEILIATVLNYFVMFN